MSSQQEAPTLDPDLGTTRSAWAPFASRAFFWLWLANTVSALGTWIQNAASAWIMTDLAPSPIMVSLVQAAAQLPVLLLALPAGALADLMDRKRHLILTNMLMLAASAVLAIVAALGRVDATILLSLTALLAVGAALNSPAWAASVPLTVPRRSLTQALVLNSVGFNIARAIGPAIGGLDPGGCRCDGRLCRQRGFLRLCRCGRRPLADLSALRRRQSTSRPSHSARRCASASPTRWLNRSCAAPSSARRRSSAARSAIWALLPLYVRQVLGLSSASFGLMMGVIGAGAVLGGLLMPRLHRLFSRNNLIMLAGAVCGLALVPLAVLPGVMTAYAACWCSASAGSSALRTCRRRCNWRRHHGCALASLALYQAVFNGGMGLGAIFWGGLGEHAGLAGNDSCRGPWRLRDRAADASGAAPGRDRRSIGPGHAGSARAVDRGGDGAASAQRAASAAARDQLPASTRPTPRHFAPPWRKSGCPAIATVRWAGPCRVMSATRRTGWRHFAPVIGMNCSEGSSASIWRTAKPWFGRAPIISVRSRPA